MGDPLYGLLVSVSVTVLLVLLFEFERARGKRFLGNVRVHLDTGIAQLSASISKRLSVFEKDVFRQSLHYFFHSVITLILTGVRHVESWLRSLLQSNRMLARKGRSGTQSRNKLHEIAEHKASVALTEEEKKKHKEALLEG